MRGQSLVGISAANRAACGITEGDVVKVRIALDKELRDVPVPSDLAKALNSASKARAAFDRLPFGLKRKHVAAIEKAKSSEVQQRRIDKLVSKIKPDLASPPRSI